MKYISLLVVACLAWSTSSVDAAAPFISNAAGTTAVPGSFIVVLKENHNVEHFQATFNDIARRVHNSGPRGRGGRRATIAHKFETIPGFTVTGTRDTVNALLDQDAVEYIEQDSIMSIDGTQTSPPSWGLPRVSQKGRLTSANTSYKYANQAGAGVTAYIVDTGIFAGHSDFGGRAKFGRNFIQGSPNTDQNGHGTHVAGTIGGTAYGVAKRVNLVGVKVLDAQGRGSTSGIVSALDWIVSVNKGKKAVVNMSLGGGASRALNDATARLYRANIPVIVAAGNDENVNACSGSPSGAKYAYTVGASDIQDRIASFSSYGNCVKIFGPGVDITSAWPTGKGAKAVLSGTSMATPHVAGVAALYLSANKNIKTAKQVYDTLTATSTKGAVKGDLRGAANRLVFNGSK